MAAPMFRNVLSVFDFKCKLNLACRQLNVSKKYYSRLVGRRPLAVYSQGEAREISRRKNRHKVSEISPTSSEGRGVNLYPDSHDGAYFGENMSTTGQESDSCGIIPPHVKYQTLHDDSIKKFSSFVQATKTKKSREKKNLILLEGRPLICQALAAGVQLQHLFFVSGKHLDGVPLDDMVANGTHLYKVKMRHMELWSELTHPPGILGLCQMPRSGECVYPRDEEQPLPLTLVCDGIRDQGYMGTLIRTAAGVGCDRVILTKGCVDIWDPKVLRTATGSQFRVPLLPNISWALLGNYIPQDANVFLADCRSDETIRAELPPPLSRKDKTRINNCIQDTEEFITEGDQQLSVDDSYSDEDLLTAYSKVTLPMTDYTAVDYLGRGQSVVIVVSGELGDPSAQARKLVYDHNGEQVFLPLAFRVDRLNPGLAASLVLFEARRQLVNGKQHI